MTPERYQQMRECYGDEVADMLQAGDRKSEFKARQKRNKTLTVKVSERDIQKLILDWLKMKGIFHRRMNTQGQLVHGGGETRMKQSVARGCPDIVGVLPGGRALFIEVKSSTWRAPSDAALEQSHLNWAKHGKKDPYETYRAQRAFQSDARAQGALVIVARSLEDVTRELQRYVGEAQREVSARER